MLFEAVHVDGGKEALNALAGDGAGSDVTLDAVAALIQAAGSARTPPDITLADGEVMAGKVRWPRPRRANQLEVRWMVDDLACAWRAHFGKEPKTSRESPFLAITLAAWKAWQGDTETLDWRIVADVLRELPRATS